MAKDQAILDFSDAGTRKMVRSMIDRLRGLHWFECRRCKDQRTLDQNSYLWGVVYPDVKPGFAEAWGEDLTVDEIHEFYKNEFLSKPIINRKTGQTKGCTEGSTRELDTGECSIYIDKIIKHAAENFGITVREARKFRQPVEEEIQL